MISSIARTIFLSKPALVIESFLAGYVAAEPVKAWELIVVTMKGLFNAG